MKHVSFKHVSACVVVLAATVPFILAGVTADDPEHKAVRQAVLDYVNSFYEVKPELIERSVHEDLVKFGYYKNPESGEWQAMTMTFEQARNLASRWNASGHLGADAPKKIVIHDVRDRTASASLDAAWGMDHFQLVKEDGTWKILHVLWQSTPARPADD